MPADQTTADDPTQQNPQTTDLPDSDITKNPDYQKANAVVETWLSEQDQARADPNFNRTVNNADVSQALKVIADLTKGAPHTVIHGNQVVRIDTRTGKVLSTEPLPSTATAKAPQSVSAPANEQSLITRDPATGNLTVVPNPNYQPGKDSVTLGNKVYERQSDGTYKVVLEGDKAPKVIAGTAPTDKKIVLQDSNGNVTSMDNPNYVAPKPTQIGTNSNDRYIVQQNQDGTTSQIENPNYVPPKPTLAAGGGPNDRYIVTMDAQGNLTQKDNPNYQPPKPTELATNTTAPYLLTLQQDDQGNWQVVKAPNPNRLTASEAWSQFISADVRDKLAKGELSLDEARDLATAGAQQSRDQETVRRDKADETLRQGELDRQNRQDQMAVVEGQAKMAESAINSGVKLGIAPPPVLARMQFAPFQMAKDVLFQGIQNGSIDPSHVPGGLGLSAPQPSGSSAPAPSGTGDDQQLGPPPPMGTSGRGGDY